MRGKEREVIDEYKHRFYRFRVQRNLQMKKENGEKAREGKESFQHHYHNYSILKELSKEGLFAVALRKVDSFIYSFIN